MKITELRASWRAFNKTWRGKFSKEALRFTGVNQKVLTKSILNAAFDNYYQISFARFCAHIKGLSENTTFFDHLVRKSTETEAIINLVEFFVKHRLISINKKTGGVKAKKSVCALLPQTLSEEQIRARIERRLGLKIQPEKPVIDLFANKAKFSVKNTFDQLPVSQASAIREVAKIIEYMPFYGKFLFVGDDDFISVLLCLADPKMEAVVHDTDLELIAAIKNIAGRLKLNIKTQCADFQNEDPGKKEFIGFLCNPLYTEFGVEKFMKYGVNRLSPDGGHGFLVVGDEAIGNRFIFLQQFFSKNNLIVRELMPGAVAYPSRSVHAEDDITEKRLSRLIKTSAITKHPRLGASIYVFEQIPFPVKRVKIRQPFYSYL